MDSNVHPRKFRLMQNHASTFEKIKIYPPPKGGIGVIIFNTMRLNVIVIHGKPRGLLRESLLVFSGF